jgi:hypothetical protein
MDLLFFPGWARVVSWRGIQLLLLHTLYYPWCLFYSGSIKLGQSEYFCEKQNFTFDWSSIQESKADNFTF